MSPYKAPTISLRDFEEEDINEFIGWIKDEYEMFQIAGSTFYWPLTTKQVKQYLNEIRKKPDSHCIYTAYQTKTKKLVGHIEIAAIDPNKHRAMLFHLILAPDERCQGLGQTIIKQALRICFDEKKLHRVGITAFNCNIHAQRCYKKVGFKYEGCMRQFHKFNTEFWDMFFFSILRHEF